MHGRCSGASATRSNPDVSKTVWLRKRRHEPPHVHVKRDDKLTKFWLTPVHEAYNYGFSATDAFAFAGRSIAKAEQTRLAAQTWCITIKS